MQVFTLFLISILPLEIKLSKERGWDINDQVNLPNECAYSKPGLTHLQNIDMDNNKITKLRTIFQRESHKYINRQNQSTTGKPYKI